MLLENGERIIKALRAQCASSRGRVFSTADLAGVAEKDQVTPALHVVLLDYAPLGTIGAEVEWKEVWGVWVVVKNVSRKDRAAAQAEDAAPLIAEVLEALLSPTAAFLREPGARPLKLAEGPPPAFSESHAYFPLAFEARAESGVGKISH